MSSDPFRSPMPPMQPSGTHTQAAILVWILGSLQILLGGCLSMVVAALAVTPLDELLTHLTPVQREVIEKVHPSLPIAAVLLLLFTVVPGVTYLVLGFFVRLGHRISTRLTLGLAIAQAGLLVLVLAINMLGSIISRDPLSIVGSLIIYGGLLAYLIVVIRTLLRLKAGGSDDLWDTQTDPWGPSSEH